MSTMTHEVTKRQAEHQKVNKNNTMEKEIPLVIVVPKQ